jgi:hypothetical protein
MLLSPDRISYDVRAEMGRRGVRQEAKHPSAALPVRAGRLIPHGRIVERTGLVPYDRPLAFKGTVEPGMVRIPLSQHTGVTAKAVVREGDRVGKGQVIGEADRGSVGARVHASIDGVVLQAGEVIVVERR